MAISSAGPTLFARDLAPDAAGRLSAALEQFTDPAALGELALGIALAIALATLLAFHPRDKGRRDLLAATDERKTLVLLGLLGAALATLVRIDQSMALVVFGVGALLRVRAAVANPHMAARGVVVVVVGLLAGLSQPLAAIVVAVAAYAVVWWLSARRSAEVKVRLVPGADRQKAQLVSMHEVRDIGCRVLSCREGNSGRSFTLLMQVPASVADDVVAKRLEARLAPEVGHAEVEFAAR